MLFSNITYLNEKQELVSDAYVGVLNKRIHYISQSPPPEPGLYGREIVGRGSLLCPGFYNAHSHAAMALLRGYGENMNLQDWLFQRIFPFEDRLQPEDVYWATLLCSAEMLRFGIVSTTDMYMKGDAMARGFIDGGIKANFAVGTSCMDPEADYKALPQYRELLSLKEQYHMHDEGRIRTDLSLHAEYTSTEKLVRQAAEEAAKLGLPVHTHAAETAKEVAECRERRQGRSPIAYFRDCGLLDSPATLAHCVHINEEDMEILAEKGCTVASCPKSNLKLASGICPVPQLLSAGVNVALGTDSVASNNNLNFLEEMRFFSLLAKGIQGDPSLISPAQTLYAASRAGALSQGRGDCGQIAPGMRADLVLLSTKEAHWQPAHNLLNNLVYSGCGSDVLMTLVDGEIRYEQGEFPHLDIEKIYAQTESSRLRILGELAAATE
ncbi:MAG: amidohydrolase [Bacillota bacterium]|nr:amidohydrolase [Bacillota bacterium]